MEQPADAQLRFAYARATLGRADSSPSSAMESHSKNLGHQMQEPTNIVYPLRIYYDASCPLCHAEMHALKQYDLKQRLDLVDCSPPNFSDDDANQAGFRQAALLRLIHARDADGQWLIGVAVFEAAYGATGITGMEKMWASPLLRPLWDRIYPWIADNRMVLSRLGVTKLFGWAVARAAKRANAKSQACANDVCALK